MSTTGGDRAGHRLRARRAGRDPQEVQARGDRLGHRDRAAPTTSPGISNLIEILAIVRGVAPAGDRGATSPDARYGDFKTAVGDEVAAWLAPVRERYDELRGDEAALEEMLAAGADKARAIATGHARRRPRGDGGRAVRVQPRPRDPPSRRLACTSGGIDRVTLELDLDVFAGPFDLLLSLILREELDLLEVELAEVVLAYLDHLEARDELDLESATEFLVLIAALLELKSRLMLPGEEIEELDDARAGRGGRGAARADARLRALPRRRRLPRARRARPSRACSTAPRRCRPRCAARRSSTPSRPTTRRCSARRSAGCCARRRRSTCSHIAMPRVALPERLAVLREPAAPRHVLVRRGGRAAPTG